MSDFSAILDQLSVGRNLTPEMASDALRQIIHGKVNGARTAAFLFGMRMKGETVEELTSLVKVMRDACIEVSVPTDHAVDLCGTGGDKSGSFNISTAAMFVAAGADVPILKHGNSGVSSRSGSFDVLKALGTEPGLNKEQVEGCFRQCGMAFLYAPNFHPAMGKVMPVRKELGSPTFFNLMGPVLNPAMVKRQVIGAYDLHTAGMLARILAGLDTELAFTVHADDGLDEFSVSATSQLYELRNGQLKGPVQVDPRQFGLTMADQGVLSGGSPEENAGIIRAVLENRSNLACQEVVLLNATFAIHASGLYDDVQEAFYEASESLGTGRAEDALNRFAEASRDFGSC